MPNFQDLTERDFPSPMGDVRDLVSAVAAHVWSGAEIQTEGLTRPGHEYRIALVEQYLPSSLGRERWRLARIIALRNAKEDAPYVHDRDRRLVASYSSICERFKVEAASTTALCERIGEKPIEHFGLAYTVKEAAGILQVPYGTVLREIGKGRLAAQKVGKEYRIHRDSIDMYLMRVDEERLQKSSSSERMASTSSTSARGGTGRAAVELTVAKLLRKQ